MKLGADPELFWVRGDNPVSVIGKLGGTKDHPRDIGQGCAVQEDNVAAEFNIPPCESLDAFIHHINYNLAFLEKEADKIGAKLSLTASAIFSAGELANPKAMEFGCEPDFNAWTMDVNPRPTASNFALRSAGGHIHMSTDEDYIQVIRAMDLHIGAQLIKVDKDTRRRELYGKAGAFRPKDYGVEYRTPSNYWISDEKLMKWVWNQCELVQKWMKDGNKIENNKYGRLIQDAINHSDEAALKKVNDYYGLSAIN